MGRMSASAHGALAVVTLKVFASAGGAVNGHSHIPLFLRRQRRLWAAWREPERRVPLPLHAHRRDRKRMDGAGAIHGHGHPLRPIVMRQHLQMA